jgi:hypothetical protein
VEVSVNSKEENLKIFVPITSKNSAFVCNCTLALYLYKFTILMQIQYFK